MQTQSASSPIRTAIPPRFQRQRERVLLILTRWQASLGVTAR